MKWAGFVSCVYSGTPGSGGTARQPPGGQEEAARARRSAISRVGFIVTNLSRPAERVVAFYNKRGTCEQWIKLGKGAIKWTRLSCCSFAANAARLQLHALAYNLANFMRTLALPEAIKGTDGRSASKSQMARSNPRPPSGLPVVAAVVQAANPPWQNTGYS